MTRAEQEFFALDNRGEEGLLVSSTHPVWTRRLQRLEQRGLARRTRTITAVENGRQVFLGAEFAIDRELIALRLTPRRKPSDAQKAAAARARNARLRSESSAPTETRGDNPADEGSNPRR